MKKSSFLVACALAFSASIATLEAKKSTGEKFIDFVEYDMDNGMHVVLNSDKTSPIVNVGIMYHVGGKNEEPHRTGFAHLFEHLMFHGTTNIPKGSLETYIREAGGYNNASTSSDRTYYYITLPANQMPLALWIESERMSNLVITEEGLRNEIEVVKEERRLRYDGSALSVAQFDMMAMEFEEHPYRMPLIGYMEHLDAASLEDVKEFAKKYYAPSNACLIISGGFDLEVAKEQIDRYFKDIPAGPQIARPNFNLERPNPQELVAQKSIKGIKEPHLITSYWVAPDGTDEAITFKFLIQLLTDSEDGEIAKLGKSGDEKMVSRISMTPEFYEDAGMVWLRASHADSVSYREVLKQYDRIFEKIAKEGIAEERINRLKKEYAKSYVDVFFSHPSIAEMASQYYFLRGGTKEFLRDPDRAAEITNNDIKKFVAKYLVPNNRRVITYSVAKNEKELN